MATAASHGDDGNPSGLAGGEHQVDDRLADRPRLSLRRMQVHAKTGAGVDLNHGAALFFQRSADVLCQHVNSRYVESHHSRGFDRAGGDLRVDDVGNVSGSATGAQVAIAPNQHARAFRRHRFRQKPLLGERLQGDGVQHQLGERCSVACTSPRVGINGFDQLCQRMKAVSDNPRWIAAATSRFPTTNNR